VSAKVAERRILPPLSTPDGKYLSGFCGSTGQCEGTRPKGWNGTPLKTCPFWQTCTCNCHTELTRMFEMTGQERIPVPNPEYIPYARTYWMPSDDPDYKMPDAAPDVASTDEVQITATGRVRKGGLEIGVQKVLLAWMERPVMERIDGLDVKTISALVYENEGATLEKAPYLGAIGAVLDRWEACGYVMLGRKPVRIVGLTADGKEKGLDWCKAKAKKS